MQRWSRLDRGTKWIVGFCGALIVLGIVMTMVVPSRHAQPTNAADADIQGRLEAQKRELEANAERMRREAQETWDAINANVDRARSDAERSGGQ